jgi:hypothetical protein
MHLKKYANVKNKKYEKKKELEVMMQRRNSSLRSLFSVFCLLLFSECIHFGKFTKYKLLSRVSERGTAE